MDGAQSKKILREKQTMSDLEQLIESRQPRRPRPALQHSEMLPAHLAVLSQLGDHPPRVYFAELLRGVREGVRVCSELPPNHPALLHLDRAVLALLCDPSQEESPVTDLPQSEG